MKTDANSLIREIKRDPKFKEFRDVITLNSKRLGVEALTTEIKEISELRSKTSVKYNGSTLETLNAVLKENLEAQAYRSRLSEICLQSKRIITQVNRACDNMTNRISINYSEEIKAFGRTKEDRSMISKNVLQFAYDYISELEGLIDIAQLIISDIDKQHYSLKLTKESIELLIHRESILS